LQPGDRVLHRRFGRGTVSGVPRGKYVPVQFGDADNRNLSPSIDDLTLLTPEEEQRLVDAEVQGHRETFAQPDPGEQHGHGDHWAVVTEDSMEFLRRLPEILNTSQVAMGMAPGMRPARLYRPPDEPEGFNLVWPVQGQGVITTLRVGRDGEPNDVVGLYPWVGSGIQHALTIERVYPWDNQVEGQIEAQLGPAIITFFDPLYATNKRFYRAGRSYEFILAGLAYSFAVIEPEPIIISDPEKIVEFRTYTGQDVSDLSPVHISTKGMAALFSIDKWDRDDYAFQGPVKSLSELELLGRRVWKLRVTVLRTLDDDKDVDLDIYVADRCFEKDKVPQVGDDVRGNLWMQGHLWMVAFDG